jgi:predicted nucleic acid-binding protein
VFCFLRDLSRLPVTVDTAPDEAGVLGMARRHRLSVYDASYLDLARRMGLALATLDAKLAQAAQIENVRLLEQEAD